MNDIEYSMRPLDDAGDDAVVSAAFGGSPLPGQNEVELVEMERILIVRTNTVLVQAAPVEASHDARGGGHEVRDDAVEAGADAASAIGSATVRAADGVVVAFLEEMRNLGYWVNEGLLEQLRLASAEGLARILDAARKAKGADVGYRPLYPNFPRQVAEASDLELWANAVIHYIGRAELGMRIMPVYDVEKREALEETTTLTVLGAASDESIAAYVNGIVNQGRPYSEADRESILLFKDHIKFDEVRLVVKENLVWFASTFRDRDLGHVFATVTDVLRYAVALSDGDITLATPSRIRLGRPQRRRILGLLEQVAGRYLSEDTLLADMASRQERWKRLAHALHAHEWKADGAPAYPKATAILTAAQSGKLRSYESTVERALAAGDLDKAVAILGQRPGVYARRIMALLRRFPGQGERARILRGFAGIADQVSSPVLIQLWNLLHGPTSAQLPWRIIVIKAAGRQRTAIIGNRMAGRDDELAGVIERALRGRNKDRFIELGERADDYTVPLDVRNASAGARQIGRGSHVRPKDDKNIVRLFMHWHDLAGAPASGAADSDDLAGAEQIDAEQAGSPGWHPASSDQADGNGHDGDAPSDTPWNAVDENPMDGGGYFDPDALLETPIDEGVLDAFIKSLEQDAFGDAESRDAGAADSDADSGEVDSDEADSDEENGAGAAQRDAAHPHMAHTATPDDEYLGNGRYRSATVDLDLSAVYFDAGLTRSAAVTYYDLRDTGAGVTHSGDITSAPHGAAEFIDVDRKTALAAGYRYVAPVVHSYSGQSFARIPEAYAGVMLRDAGNEGEVFEPSTVEVKYDLGSDDVNSVPFLYDLAGNEIIWWDIAAHGNDLLRLNNVADNQDRIAIALHTLLLSRNMSVGRLARLSATVVRRVALDDDLRGALRDAMGPDGMLPADADHVWEAVGEGIGADGGAAGAVRTVGAVADDASADSPDAVAGHAVAHVHVHGEDHRILPALRDEDVEHIDGWESEKVLGLLG